jgi:uncharacterized protein (TIGR03382 family)
MNKSVIGLMAVGSLVLTGPALADLNGISWDTVDSGMGLGTTYQLYADVNAGDQVNAVYGDDAVALQINAVNGTFYQNAFGGNTPPSAALIAVFPSLAYDSFVSIGRLTDTDDGMLEIGIDWTNFEAGGPIFTDNGSWFATPDNAQVHEVGGRVLIGQFTVAGEGLEGTINIQGKDGALNNWNATDVYFNTVPAPGALALLGLAGLVARRRRK